MEKGYAKLEIYQRSIALALKIHRMTLTLPKFELYEEGSQIRRSSKSVSANIVEGYCLRRHKNEHRAFGSCEETKLHLNLLYQTISLQNETFYCEINEQYDILGKMIYRFIEAVLSGHLPPNYIRE